MWPRTVELMLGVWLCVSPFVFRGTERVEQFLVVDLTAGSIVIVLSILSFWSRAGWAHFVTAGVAFALAASAYLGWERPGPPAAENEIIVGLTLLLLGILPNHCTQPPAAWRNDVRS